MERNQLSSKTDDGKTFEKNLLLIFCLLREKEIYLAIFQKLIQIVKKKKKNSINDSKQRKKSAMTLSCSKKLSVILKRMIFVAWVVFIL